VRDPRASEDRSGGEALSFPKGENELENSAKRESGSLRGELRKKRARLN